MAVNETEEKLPVFNEKYDERLETKVMENGGNQEMARTYWKEEMMMMSMSTKRFK